MNGVFVAPSVVVPVPQAFSRTEGDKGRSLSSAGMRHAAARQACPSSMFIACDDGCETRESIRHTCSWSHSRDQGICILRAPKQPIACSRAVIDGCLDYLAQNFLPERKS